MTSRSWLFRRSRAEPCEACCLALTDALEHLAAAYAFDLFEEVAKKWFKEVRIEMGISGTKPPA